MAQNISRRRGKSPIKTRLEQERKASRKDPEGKKAFVKGVGTIANTALNLSAVGPTVRGVGAAVRGYKKYKKFQNTPSISLYRGEPGYKTFSQMKKMLKDDPQYGKWFSEGTTSYGRKPTDVLKKVTVSPKEYKALLKGMKDPKQGIRGPVTTKLQAKEYQFKPGTTMRKKIYTDSYSGTVTPEIRRRAQIIPKNKSGGLTDTVPPKRGPNPQGLKKGGCPHRETGVRSPYKGVSAIQVKGQKFIGVK